MAQNLFALVLAGGSGERFWPLSRRHRPKQLLSLFSDETLLEGALARLKGMIPPERILVLTNEEQEAAVRGLVGEIPQENVIAEPAKRDTAPAIALGVGMIARRDPEATMVVLPADHLITDVSGFQETVRTAAAAAEQCGSLVTIGIQPTWACPSFGYIEEGAEVAIKGAAGKVFEVKRFREKPNPDLAEAFLQRGNFRWNAGMFVWQVASIRREFSKHEPVLAGFVERLATADDPQACLKETFPALHKLSIDYAVMERAERVLMVEAGFDWDDVGGWVAASKYWQRDGEGNAVRGQVTTVDAFQNIVYSEGQTRVALVGVNDLIVVQSGESILVCKRGDAERIKLLVGKLPRELQ